MILEGGHCERGIESTIIGFDGDLPILYRLGAIALDEIEKIIGKVTVKNKNNSSPDAPGMLLRHYAPATTTVLSNNIIASIQEFSTAKIGLLLFSKIVECDSNIHQEILSQKGDFKEAASKLYAALHKLDKLGLDIIIAERLPDIGLGKSINDRLERATEK